MFHRFKCQIYSFCLISLSSFFLLLLERSDNFPCRDYKKRAHPVWGRACIHCGGCYIFLHYHRASWELLSELVESGLLLETLLRVRPILLIQGLLLFSIQRRKWILLVFISHLGRTHKELLIYCCESLVELGQCFARCPFPLHWKHFKLSVEVKTQ